MLPNYFSKRVNVYSSIISPTGGAGGFAWRSLEHATLETDVYLQRVICSYLHTRHVNLNGLRA